MVALALDWRTHPYGELLSWLPWLPVSGAGLVTVVTERENTPALHAHLPEAMPLICRSESDRWSSIRKATVILIGPWFGWKFFREIGAAVGFTACKQATNSDYVFGALSRFCHKLCLPNSQTIFTPHKKEWVAHRVVQTKKSSQRLLTNFLSGTQLYRKEWNKVSFSE